MADAEPDPNIAVAASALEAARAPGAAIDALSPELAPKDATEAWAIHQAARATHGPVVGWKTGAPTPEAEPVLGEIAADTFYQSPATLPAGALRLWAVEAEIAVTFGRDFAARDEPYTEEEALAGVANWHAAIEVLDTAYADWSKASALEKIADRMSHGALVLGPGAPERPEGALDRLAVRLLIDGSAAFAHRGGNTAGDPTRLIVALVNRQRTTDRPVRAGDVVTTGSTTPFLQARPGQRVVAEFDGLGAAELVIGA